MTTHPKPARSKMWAWRAAHDLSLRDVADLVGLSESMLSRVERGERQLRATTKALVARRLGVPIGDLFDIEPVEEALA
jgi:transcriptional regulator with XRE-family HTH domain